jgi:hypothetical protein
MGARWIDPGCPRPRGCFASTGTGLRRGRPAADPDRTTGAKHASRREGHLLPIVGVVRGPRPRHEVRPAGRLWIRPRTARPRSTGDPRAERRRLGEPEQGHARAAARIAPQANRSLLFHVRPGQLERGSVPPRRPRPCSPAELLNVLMLPDLERAERIGEVCLPASRTVAEPADRLRGRRDPSGRSGRDAAGGRSGTLGVAEPGKAWRHRSRQLRDKTVYARSRNPSILQSSMRSRSCAGRIWNEAETD